MALILKNFKKQLNNQPVLQKLKMYNQKINNKNKIIIKLFIKSILIKKKQNNFIVFQGYMIYLYII